jgi:hypothetical protein
MLRGVHRHGIIYRKKIKIYKYRPLKSLKFGSSSKSSFPH